MTVLNSLLFSFLLNSSVPSVASGNLLGWLLGPFDMRPVVFDNFLCIWYDKLFKTYLASFLPSPEISIFPQSLFSFSGKLYHKNTRYQEASLSLLQGWSFFLGLSVDRELGYEYIEFKFTLQCFYVTSSMLYLYVYLYCILKILVFKDTEDDGIGIYYNDSLAFFHNTYTTASE